MPVARLRPTRIEHVVDGVRLRAQLSAAALDAAGRVEMAGCALPVLQFELENLAMVM